ncbi:LysR family transcriptional regulator [Marinobacterium sp. D7]|uniref:LysR family transcriptional regulator n=1 Tax=Marinobacterium ramblicola TaxID=2849041 RepID=UPI001C2D8560|nr:LysR family transcriptional regulator [Marinobacterium ramblicola]MBV1787373.1 LysR family transcriptional regulator [Marinobacterium ramblicola]
MLEIRALRYFLAVVDERGFTAAARRLHVAQPAVSMAIRKLEESLALNLFHRRERGIELTDEGHILLEHARRIIRATEDAELEMRELQGLDSGEVRIGIPSMLGSYYFPPILMAFRHRYPKLQLTVVESGARKIQQMISEGEIDLGVIVSNTPPEDLETRPFLRDQMTAVMPMDHPLAARESVAYDDFFKEELVVFKQGYFHREVLDRLAQESNYPLQIGFETNLLPLIKQIVRQGFAITTLLAMVIAEDADLVARPFSEPVWLDLSIAWRRDGYLSRANRAFVDFLLEHAASEQSRLGT